jgi:hypothetical protein
MITQVDDNDKVMGQGEGHQRMVCAICSRTSAGAVVPPTGSCTDVTRIWPLCVPRDLICCSGTFRIDTTNPPGNEVAAARFFADILQREGIEHRLFESAPGRGIIWARLAGDGSRRPLILLNHLDVVPHSPEFWSVPAFGGQTRSGFI